MGQDGVRQPPPKYPVRIPTMLRCPSDSCVCPSFTQALEKAAGNVGQKITLRYQVLRSTAAHYTARAPDCMVAGQLHRCTTATAAPAVFVFPPLLLLLLLPLLLLCPAYLGSDHSYYTQLLLCVYYHHPCRHCCSADVYLIVRCVLYSIGGLRPQLLLRVHLHRGPRGLPRTAPEQGVMLGVGGMTVVTLSVMWWRGVERGLL